MGSCRCRRLNEYINNVLYRSIEENIPTISETQAERLLNSCNNVRLVDVRSPQEYAEGHRRVAILIPSYEMENRAERILTNKNDIIILYCSSGARARRSGLILRRLGYNNVYVLCN